MNEDAFFCQTKEIIILFLIPSTQREPMIKVLLEVTVFLLLSQPSGLRDTKKSGLQRSPDELFEKNKYLTEKSKEISTFLHF